MTKIGSNSGFAAGQLVAFAERIERVTEEIDAGKDDLKEIYAEAKSTGFDTAILRKVMRLRQIPKADRQEAEAITELYMAVLDGGDRAEIEKSEAEADGEE